MTTTTYSFPRNMPKPVSTRRKIDEIESYDSWSHTKDLENGDVAVLQSELGFMEVSFHVAVYRPAPRLFQPDRLKLVSSLEFEHIEAAEIAFDCLDIDQALEV